MKIVLVRWGVIPNYESDNVFLVFFALADAFNTSYDTVRYIHTHIHIHIHIHTFILKFIKTEQHLLYCH